MASIAEYPLALWPRPRQRPVESKAPASCAATVARTSARRSRRWLVHQFASGVLSPHLGYRQRCLFAAETVGDRGSVRKVYRDGDVATPYDPTRLGSHRRSRS